MRARAALIFALVLMAGCASTPAPEKRPVALPSNRQLVLPPLRPRSRAETMRYALGPRDVLTVRIFGLEKARETATFDVEVDPTGTVDVPFAGSIPASGKSIDEVRRLIVEKLGAGYIVDPQATVTVKEYRSRPITVAGAVEKGGIFYLQTTSVTLLEALSMAGGLSPRAGTSAIVLTPKSDGTTARADCDLVALLLRGDERQNVWLEPNASVTVVTADDLYVVGYVARPGNFAYHQPLTVTQAVGLAGGVDLRSGSPSAVTITRATDRGIATIEVDLDAIAEGEGEDIAVYPGDTIGVGRTFAKACLSLLEFLLGKVGFGAGYYL